MKIGVFGAGAWGTALAYTCARSGNEVIHWGYAGIFDGLADIEKPANVQRTDNMADLKSNFDLHQGYGRRNRAIYV